MRNWMTYRFKVNGSLCETDVTGSTPLVSVLRDQLGLLGTKIGCGQGECGACSILLDRQVVCSCLTAVCSVGNRAVTTIEGLSGGESLHPVQQAFVEHG